MHTVTEPGPPTSYGNTTSDGGAFENAQAGPGGTGAMRTWKTGPARRGGIGPTVTEPGPGPRFTEAQAGNRDNTEPNTRRASGPLHSGLQA